MKPQSFTRDVPDAPTMPSPSIVQSWLRERAAALIGDRRMDGAAFRLMRYLEDTGLSLAAVRLEHVATNAAAWQSARTAGKPGAVAVALRPFARTLCWAAPGGSVFVYPASLPDEVKS